MNLRPQPGLPLREKRLDLLRVSLAVFIGINKISDALYRILDPRAR